jgi:hypothetical protein
MDMIGGTKTAKLQNHVKCFEGDGKTMVTRKASASTYERHVGPTGNRKYGPVGSFSLFMAVFFLAIISFVHLLHTCKHYETSGASSSAYSSEYRRTTAYLSEARSESTCIACMLLNVISTAQISLACFISAWVLSRELEWPFRSDGARSKCVATQHGVRAPPLFSHLH